MQKSILRPAHKPFFRRPLCFPVIVGLVLACDAGHFVGPDDERRLTAVSPGPVVTGEAGGLVGPLVIRLLDGGGQPVVGETVQWHVSAGRTSSSSSNTNDDGYAETTWTLGSEGGEQDLTASAKGSQPLHVKANVEKSPVMEITVSPARLSLDAIGQEAQLQATATREDGTLVPPGHITFTTSEPEVISVTNKGKVVALAFGTASVIVWAGLLTDTVPVAIIEAEGTSPPVEAEELAAPTGLTVTGTTTTSVGLTWNGSASEAVTGYKVYRKTSSGGTATLAASPSSTQATISSLSSGTTYYFEVTAVSSDNESPASEEVNATTNHAATAPSGSHDPPPVGNSKILFDTRAGAKPNSRGKGGDLQAASSLSGVAALFDELHPSSGFSYSRNFDGSGTAAVAALWPGGSTDRDVGRSMSIYLPSPLPSAVYVQMKLRMGRHPDDTNSQVIGTANYFDLTSNIDTDNNAGRKMIRFLRSVPDGGADWSFDLLYDGPSPGANPHFGYVKVNHANHGKVNSGGYLVSGGFFGTYQPESYVAQPITITYYAKAGSSNGDNGTGRDPAADGIIRHWWNGNLAYEKTDVQLGAYDFHRIKFPMVIRSPEKDMTEYWWDIVIWTP